MTTTPPPSTALRRDLDEAAAAQQQLAEREGALDAARARRAAAVITLFFDRQLTPARIQEETGVPATAVREICRAQDPARYAAQAHANITRPRRAAPLPLPPELTGRTA